MKKRLVILNNGQTVTLYKQETGGDWTHKVGSLLDGMDRLDAMLMSESHLTVDDVEFSYSELSTLKCYVNESTSVYSIQKIRQLASGNCPRLKQLIKTIRER